MAAERFCPICKHKNPFDAKQCHFCGAHLESRPAPVTTATGLDSQPDLVIETSYHLEQLARLPADALMLFVMNEQQPEIIRNTEKVVLGRNVAGDPPVTCDLSPYNAAELGVSRQHALITFDGGSCTVADLGSTNGTWLNENRLIPQKRYLTYSGDLVRLGNMQIFVYFHGGAPPTATEEIILLIEEPRSSASLHPRVTVSYLSVALNPYLQALADLQRVIDDSHGQLPREVVINTISALRQDLPISVSLNGASDAVRVLKSLIPPWQKKHIELLTKLHSRASVDFSSQQGWAGQQSSDVTRMIRESSLNEEIANNIWTELQSELGDLALKLIADTSPLLDESDKARFVQRVLPAITTLAIGKLQVSLEREAA